LFKSALLRATASLLQLGDIQFDATEALGADGDDGAAVRVCLTSLVCLCAGETAP